VITEVNGQAVKNPRDLAVDIAAVQAGDETRLQVLHDGDSKAMSVKVGQMPNEQMARQRHGRAVARAHRPGWHRCRRTCATRSICRTVRRARSSARARIAC
jgi:serine protease Do